MMTERSEQWTLLHISREFRHAAISMFTSSLVVQKIKLYSYFTFGWTWSRIWRKGTGARCNLGEVRLTRSSERLHTRKISTRINVFSYHTSITKCTVSWRSLSFPIRSTETKPCRSRRNREHSQSKNLYHSLRPQFFETFNVLRKFQGQAISPSLTIDTAVASMTVPSTWSIIPLTAGDGST